MLFKSSSSNIPTKPYKQCRIKLFTQEIDYFASLYIRHQREGEISLDIELHIYELRKMQTRKN